VLDRSLVAMGTVVPQNMWSPLSEDRRQLVGETELQMPVFFENVDGKLGLSLQGPVAGRCDGLINAQRSAPLGQRSVTNIRITWLGYKEFRCQIQIRDETREHGPVTVSKFAHHVAQAVDAFFKTCQPDPGCLDPRYGQWRIGQGGIELGDITIIGVVQVAAGCWMPILQLTRYVFLMSNSYSYVPQRRLCSHNILTLAHERVCQTRHWTRGPSRVDLPSQS